MQSSFHNSSREFVRFAIVGCLNVLVTSVIFYLAYKEFPLGQIILENTGSIGLGIKNILDYFGIASVNSAIATIVGYLGGMVNSYVLNRSWTFRVEERSFRQIWRFVTLNLAGLTLGTSLMFLFVDVMGGPYLVWWATIISMTTLLNYFGNKFWTFAT